MRYQDQPRILRYHLDLEFDPAHTVNRTGSIFNLVIQLSQLPEGH